MAARTPLAKAKLEAFASRLRAARIGAGCPSMEAGARHCKTAPSAYARHEQAVLMATVMMIERYARAFKCDPCWLAFGPKGVSPRPVVKPARRPWQSKYV